MPGIDATPAALPLSTLSRLDREPFAASLNISFCISAVLSFFALGSKSSNETSPPDGADACLEGIKSSKEMSSAIDYSFTK